MGDYMVSDYIAYWQELYTLCCCRSPHPRHQQLRVTSSEDQGTGPGKWSTVQSFGKVKNGDCLSNLTSF